MRFGKKSRAATALLLSSFITRQASLSICERRRSSLYPRSGCSLHGWPNRSWYSFSHCGIRWPRSCALVVNLCGVFFGVAVFGFILVVARSLRGASPSRIPRAVILWHLRTMPDGSRT